LSIFSSASSSVSSITETSASAVAGQVCLSSRN
jgi:hypothetical protein